MKRLRLLAAAALLALLGACNSSTQEIEDFEDDANIRSGTFRIANVTSGKCLDVYGSQTTDGAAVINWPCTGGTNQQWKIDNLGNGIHRITAVHSGKVLDVSGASQANGALMQQWTWGNVANQKWLVRRYSDGSFDLVATHSNKCVDLPGSNTQDGVRFQQYTCNSTGAQRFRLTRLSGTTPPPPPPPPAGGNGTGLAAEYFDNANFSGTRITRTDATVNFDWAAGTPDSRIGADTFSARWVGQVQPRYSGSYTFITTSDDGVRLWVNGQQIINNWTDHAAVENQGTISLNAGQKYDIKLEFYENGGLAVMKLAWQSASQTREIIPQTQLYPGTLTPPPPPPPGPPGPPPPPPPPASCSSGACKDGQWSGVIAFSDIAIHTHVLPSGKVLYWGGGDSTTTPGSYNGNNAYLWDPATGTHTLYRNTTTEVFCSGSAFLPDGRLLVAGGHVGDGVGKIDTNIFDFSNNSWTRVQDMNAGRWYPTVSAMGNGEMLVLAGTSVNGTTLNTTPQVWQTGGGWRSLTSITYNQAYYWPLMFPTPDGRMLYVGPSDSLYYLNTSGTGSWVSAGSRGDGVYRDYSVAIQYRPGKVLLVGGGSPVASATVVDLATAKATATGSMSVARKQHNGTVLPNGTVLITGGLKVNKLADPDPVNQTRSAEIWDPNTGQFRVLAAESVPRMYHSTAVLLPDGRVLSAGGGRPNGGEGDHRDGQVFSPPYLFKGDNTAAVRPTISSVAGVVGYGQGFSISTPDAANISRVTLVAPTSVTHSTNMNQRFFELSFTKGTNQLNLTMTSDRNQNPPGYYMLFILDNNGVPSVAKFVRIG